MRTRILRALVNASKSPCMFNSLAARIPVVHPVAAFRRSPSATTFSRGFIDFFNSYDSVKTAETESALFTLEEGLKLVKSHQLSLDAKLEKNILNLIFDLKQNKCGMREECLKMRDELREILKNANVKIEGKLAFLLTDQRQEKPVFESEDTKLRQPT